MSTRQAKRFVRPVLLTSMIAGIAISGIISCQSTSPSEGETENQTAQNQDEGDQTTSGMSQEDRQKEESYESRMKKAEKDISQQEKARKTKADVLYQKARTLLTKGEYDKALEETKRVLELEPTHKKAEDLKDTLLSLKGQGNTTSNQLNKMQDRFNANLEQKRVEIESKIKKSKQLIQDEQFTRAKNKLSTLQTTLKGTAWMDSETFNNYKQKVDKLLKTARRKSKAQKEQIQAKLKQKAQKKAIEAEQKQKMQEIRWTDRMMQQAILHFKQEEYDQAIDVTDSILTRFPNFQAAKDLQRDARKARAGEWKKKIRQKKTEEWKNFQERMIAKRIPQDELLKFPDPEYWKKVNQRRTESEPISATDEGEEQQKLFSLRKKLKSESTSLEFANSNLRNVLDTLGEKHDLNYVLDSDAEKHAKKKRTIFLKDLRLGNALSLVTQKYGLKYDLREGLIFVTTPSNVRPQTELQTFKTRSLVYLLNDVKDFNSKSDIGLQGSNDRSKNSLKDLRVTYQEEDSNNDNNYPPYGSDKAEVEKEEVKSDKKEINLANMVRENVAPDTWDHENTSVQQAYNGMLFVRNTPEVLAKVERFVDDLRSFAGSMVNVSVRFLNVRDEFLQHFGVEFKRASTGTPASIIQRSDETRNRRSGIFSRRGTSNLGTGPNQTRTSPGPGSDFMFHSNYQSKATLPGESEDPPNTQLTNLQNTGGLGLTYEVLAGTDYQAVLRALEKDDKSYVMDSTHFTLFNTQRANINIGTQKAFLQDFDVQPAAGTTAIDPVIGVVGTGLVLDVRPIISFDRRYVTLQLLPSITSDVTFRTFPVLEIDLDPIVIDLPQVEVKKVSTTVRLPDRGGLLLGGLTRTETLNKTQGVPVLKDIPLLGALFKETVDRESGRELRILVNVEILNTAERQAKAYGGSSSTNIRESGQ